MIRSMLAIAAGYFSILFLNSFAHLIVSFYFKTEITLAGVANLPSLSWAIVITLLQLAFGLFGGLLSTTIAEDNKRIVILGFILLMIIISLLDYSILKEREPLWYLLSAPTLKIAGLFLGYRLQIKQTQSRS